MVDVVEVPFQILINDWIWYPSREDVFWIEKETIDSVQKYKSDMSDEELKDSSYCKKYLKMGEDLHIDALRGAIKLWDSIQKEGYDVKRGVITCSILDNGRLELIDGFHRLDILDYLHYDGNIRIEIVDRGKGWSDFKNKLKKLGKLYTPIFHPDIPNASWYRGDSMMRLNAIRSEIKIPVDNIIDLGSCEGFMCFGLFDKVKKHIYGVEENHLRFEISSYLNRMYNGDSDKIVFYNEDFVKFLQNTDKYFDVGVFLSTFHHLLIHKGITAWEDFKNLSDKIEILFFSVAMKDDPVWPNQHTLLMELNRDTIPEYLKKHWGYNKYKTLPVKTNQGRILFKFWRE